MVKLICFVKRKPGMSRDEFHTYWREVHGPLVAGTKSGKHAVRYEQNHRAAATYRTTDSSDGFDGVTEQWFESVDDFYASLQEDDYPLIEADVEKFIDTTALTFILTEVPVVIVDGPTS